MEELITQYYLRIEEENNFSFVVNGIHDIKDTDIAITSEDYDQFFELQSQGKQFRLKEAPSDNTLFGIVEEYIPPVDNTPPMPSLDERVTALEDLMLEIL